MDILPGSDFDRRTELGLTAAHCDLLDRNNAVTSRRNNSARHHLDTVVGSSQREGRVAGGLRCLYVQPTITVLDRVTIEGDPVHRNTIERGLIAFRIDVLAQNRASTLCERQ